MPKIEADTVATNPSPSLADESYSFAPLRVLQLYSCKGQGRTTHTAVELSTRDFRYVQDQADGPWSMAIARYVSMCLIMSVEVWTLPTVRTCSTSRGCYTA